MIYYVVANRTFIPSGEVSNVVALVGAGDKKEAMTKALILFRPYSLNSIAIAEIEDGMFERLENFYHGGMVLASFEDMGD